MLIHMSARTSAHRSIHTAIHLAMHMSIRISIHLSVHICITLLHVACLYTMYAQAQGCEWTYKSDKPLYALFIDMWVDMRINMCIDFDKC